MKKEKSGVEGREEERRNGFTRVTKQFRRVYLKVFCEVSEAIL